MIAVSGEIYVPPSHPAWRGPAGEAPGARTDRSRQRLRRGAGRPRRADTTAARRVRPAKAGQVVSSERLGDTLGRRPAASARPSAACARCSVPRPCDRAAWLHARPERDRPRRVHHPDRAGPAGTGRAVAVLTQALALWTGAAFGEFADEAWAQAAAAGWRSCASPPKRPGPRQPAVWGFRRGGRGDGRPRATNPFRDGPRALLTRCSPGRAARPKRSRPTRPTPTRSAQEAGTEPSKQLRDLERRIATGWSDPTAASGATPSLPTGTVTCLLSGRRPNTVRGTTIPSRAQACLTIHEAVLRDEVGRRGGNFLSAAGDACAPLSASSRTREAAVAAQRSLTPPGGPAGCPLLSPWGCTLGMPATTRAPTTSRPSHGIQARRSRPRRPDPRVLRHSRPGPTIGGVGPSGGTGCRDSPTACTSPSSRPRDSLVTSPRQCPLGRQPALEPVIVRRAPPRAGRSPHLLEQLLAGDHHRVGGIGKTRLALEAGHLHEADDGTRLVELGRLDAPDQVDEFVASALGISVRVGSAGGRPSSPGWPTADAADPRRLRAPAGSRCRLVEAIAAEASATTVLATSREPLTRGERLFPLGALSLPGEGEHAKPSRSSSTAPARAAPDDESPSRRWRRSAAARRHPPGHRAGRGTDDDDVGAGHRRPLGERFRLLTGGRRTAMARHQTLRPRSSGRPPPGSQEQRLFDRLSVFAGPFNLRDAVAMEGEGADELDVLDRLSSLVNRSLVVHGNDLMPYRLLARRSGPSAA